MPWKYEPDEVPKHKHNWEHDFAGFISVNHDTFVGKCPHGMTLEDAQALLQTAIEWSPRNWRSDFPKRLYVVHEGVLYRATPTNPGVSYHAFPEHPTRFPRSGQALKAAVLLEAERQGCEAEIRKWMNW